MLWFANQNDVSCYAWNRYSNIIFAEIEMFTGHVFPRSSWIFNIMLNWNVYPETYTNYPRFEFFFTHPSLLMAIFIIKLTFRALAPCHLLWRRAIHRARNTSSWSFHGGTVWLDTKLKLSVSGYCIYAAIIFHSFFIYGPWFNRDPRESWTISKFFLFFSLFYQASFKTREKF